MWLCHYSRWSFSHVNWIPCHARVDQLIPRIKTFSSLRMCFSQIYKMFLFGYPEMLHSEINTIWKLAAEITVVFASSLVSIKTTRTRYTSVWLRATTTIRHQDKSTSIPSSYCYNDHGRGIILLLYCMALLCWMEVSMNEELAMHQVLFRSHLTNECFDNIKTTRLLLVSTRTKTSLEGMKNTRLMNRILGITSCAFKNCPLSLRLNLYPLSLWFHCITLLILCLLTLYIPCDPQACLLRPRARVSRLV